MNHPAPPVAVHRSTRESGLAAHPARRCRHTAAVRDRASRPFATAIQRKPRTSCISNRPRSCAATHAAARAAPLANVIRLDALCVISTRSPSVANHTVCSPTTSRHGWSRNRWFAEHARQSDLRDRKPPPLSNHVPGVGDHLAHAQRGAGRASTLCRWCASMISMSASPPITLAASSSRRKTQIHTDAHVGGKDDGDILGRRTDRGLCWPRSIQWCR